MCTLTLKPCSQLSQSRQTDRGRKTHSSSQQDTLIFNNSLNNSHRADKTTYVILEYSRLSFYPACPRWEESSGNKYSISLQCSLCFPRSSFLFYSPPLTAFDTTAAFALPRAIMNEKRNMTHRSQSHSPTTKIHTEF